MKIRLMVSEEHFSQIASELIAKGFEIDDSAELILSEKNVYADRMISRGLVLGFFHDAFGSSTKKGAYMTAICSGMVFGCFHLLNLINTTNRTAIYAQVIANVCTGFLWGAVYLRKRNIFALMLLHAVSDIAPMVSSGYLTGKKDVSAAIDSTSPLVMIVAAIYVVAGIYVLRDEKMHYISEKTATVHPSTV